MFFKINVFIPSPLMGGATHVDVFKINVFIPSPLMGEGERSSDKGGYNIFLNIKYKYEKS